MPKPIGSPRNLTSVQDQWETVQVALDPGVSVVYHRRQVSRDSTNAIVGTPGPWVAITKQWAELPANIQNALTTAANYGDTL